MKSSNAEKAPLLAFVPREVPHTRALPPMANVAAILREHGTGRFKLRGLGDNAVSVNGHPVGEGEVDVVEGDRVDVGAYVLEIRRRAKARQESASGRPSFAGLKAFSPAMKAVTARIERFAKSELAALVSGPSGAGKELVARALHHTSPRADGPFLAINCGALSATLIESELFGYVKGAFTGANDDKEGAFEACRGGTLFLDEIGELPLELQPKLLRVLEAQAVRKVGGTEELDVDVRIIAATHRDLRDLVARGLFREDLYHRLRVLDLTVPALAERPEDILPFAEHFLRESQCDKWLAPDAEVALLAAPWPGNVRELKNVILRAAVLAEGAAIHARDLELEAQAPVLASVSPSPARPERPLTVRRSEQRALFLKVLNECGNNRAEAARRLGLSRSTLHAQLLRAGISLKFDREDL